jgi:broad specificity phosphatase PhoE
MNLTRHSKEGIMAQDLSPLTGIIEEDKVVIDFGEFEGKSVLEIADTRPEFYQFLLEQKETGNFSIRRTKDKIFRLYIHQTHLN